MRSQLAELAEETDLQANEGPGEGRTAAKTAGATAADHDGGTP
jgi:hypothetical protein